MTDPPNRHINLMRRRSPEHWSDSAHRLCAGRCAHLPRALIVGFRNRLVHEYPQIDDEAVYSIAERDAPVLRVECAALHDEAGDAG